jgi:ABC-type nitrate/sulfonate/bicarbonate transport system substrate-binding protein
MEPMNITVEVWPVAADEAGLWLLSGDDSWRYGPVASDGDVHFEVEYLLREHGIDPAADVLVAHSTSWRPDGPTIVLTYIAVVKVSGFALDAWPDAAPITADLTEAVGKPPTHAANEAPIPRMVDVLFHGLRHLRYLLGTDRATADAMGDLWQQHLGPFEPALAGMYSEPHRAA